MPDLSKNSSIMSTSTQENQETNITIGQSHSSNNSDEKEKIIPVIKKNNIQYQSK
jgi:hypothetical protein